MLVAPPGPRARALAERLARFEAPGINTLLRGEPAIAWREALGSNVVDLDGNRYLDFTAGFGVANIGHRHPAVVSAIKQQAESLVHGLGDVHPHEQRVDLAERLAALVPVDDPVVYWAISGADAVEVALKTAILATGRTGLVAFAPSYHGLTLGALSVTSRRAFREPFQKHLHQHVERLPFGAPASRLNACLLGGDRKAAVVVEPIVGREGVLIPPDGWLGELAEICARARTLLIVDEIFTGFGRTGRVFASERDGLKPDIVCVGKALGGGTPIAAAVGSRRVMEHWQSDGEARHTATFVANPIACSAALATIEVLERQELTARAARLEHTVESVLNEASGRGSSLRGRGLLWGIEMPTAASASKVATKAAAAGLLILAGGERGNVLQIAPPLVITEEQLAHGTRLLSRLVDESRG